MAGEVLATVPGTVLAVARREYEATVLELARLIASGPATPARLATVAGLSFVGEGGAVVHNPDRPYLDDLDALPPVAPVYARHLDIRQYFNPNAKPPMVTLATSRGCPYRCSFCLHPQTLTGRVARYRAIDNVLDEVAWCLDNFPGLRTIFFEGRYPDRRQGPLPRILRRHHAPGGWFLTGRPMPGPIWTPICWPSCAGPAAGRSAPGLSRPIRLR